MHVRTRLLLAFTALVALGLAARMLPLLEWTLASLHWIEGLGSFGLILFVLLFIPACLLFFPDVILNMAAGLLWGVVLGSVAVSLGRVLGASAVFLVVRRLSQKAGWRAVMRRPQFAAAMRAVDQEGFKMALMLRLSPLFPLPLFHALLALTNLSWRTFALSTLIGALPRTVVAAYIGAGARSLADLSGGAAPSALPPWAFWGGLLVTLAVTGWLTQFARRCLHQAQLHP